MPLKTSVAKLQAPSIDQRAVAYLNQPRMYYLLSVIGILLLGAASVLGAPGPYDICESDFRSIHG
jgi:membrane-bound ClpP family serine protease